MMKVPMPDVFSQKRSLEEEELKSVGFPDSANQDSIEYVTAASYCNFLLTNGHVIFPTYIPCASSKPIYCFYRLSLPKF